VDEWRVGTIDVGRLPDAGVVPRTKLTVRSVLPWRDGFLAVGTASQGGAGIVWTSPDGSTWTRMPVRANGFDQVGYLFAAVSTGRGAFVLGLDRDLTGQNLTAWPASRIRSAPHHPVDEPPTTPTVRVVDFAPWQGDAVAEGLALSPDRGDCWSPSIITTRTDAWRCHVGDQVLDPCFARPIPMRAVLCPVSPRTVKILQWEDPLPLHHGLAETRTPWMVVLEGGALCRAATAIKPPVRDGLVLRMICVPDHRTGFVWGDLRVSGDRWTVTTSQTEQGPLGTTGVTEVYR
jgi:hypothetical protein